MPGVATAYLQRDRACERDVHVARHHEDAVPGKDGHVRCADSVDNARSGARVVDRALIFIDPMTRPQDSNLQPPTPELDDRQKLALLCRILQREGYDDHLAGHITVTQDDGSLLVNPFGLRWEELSAADILRIDLDGNVLEGSHPVNPGVMLHLALHAKRDDVRWTIHNHSRWGTVWAGAHRAPPAYDQSSTYCGSIAVVDELSLIHISEPTRPY